MIWFDRSIYQVGYCQGLSFLAAALLLHMPEEQAFNLLVKIMFKYGLRDLFKQGFWELHLKFYMLERWVTAMKLFYVSLWLCYDEMLILHARTYSLVHLCTHRHACTHSHTPPFTHQHTHIHTLTSIHAHRPLFACTHIHSLTRTYARLHTHSYVYIY